MEISTLKSKVIAFKGLLPVRSKTVLNNTILEQINTFTYLEYKISYKDKKDIT
jgi:hypothetical protein